MLDDAPILASLQVASTQHQIDTTKSQVHRAAKQRQSSVGRKDSASERGDPNAIHSSRPSYSMQGTRHKQQRVSSSTRECTCGHWVCLCLREHAVQTLGCRPARRAMRAWQQRARGVHRPCRDEKQRLVRHCTQRASVTRACSVRALPDSREHTAMKGAVVRV